MLRGAIGLTLFFICFAIVAVWYLDIRLIERDTQKVLEQAQAAAKLADMVKMKERLVRLQSNMEKRGMTRGPVVVGLKKATSMEMIYGSVVRINQSFQSLPRSSAMSYRSSLASLRKEVEVLQLHIQGWFMVRNWRWLVWLPICLVLFFIIML